MIEIRKGLKAFHAGMSVNATAYIASQHSGRLLTHDCFSQDVQLQNAGAWGALASAPEVSAAADTTPDEGGDAAADGGASAPDALWTEFQSREQDQLKRDKLKKAQEERLQADKATVPSPPPLSLSSRTSGTALSRLIAVL